MSYEDNNEDFDGYDPVDLNDLYNDVFKDDEFCWACEIGLNAENPDPDVVEVYLLFKSGRLTMTQKKLLNQIVQKKEELFPTHNTHPFTVDHAYRHFNFHVKDYFTELIKQSEALSVQIENLNNTILKAKTAYTNKKQFKVLANNFKILGEAMRMQLIIKEKIENYRDNNGTVRVSQRR